MARPFLYLQRTSFRGKVAGRTFGVSTTTSGGRFDVVKLGEILPAFGSAIKREPSDLPALELPSAFPDARYGLSYGVGRYDQIMGGKTTIGVTRDAS